MNKEQPNKNKFEFYINDFMSPGCHCNLENKIMKTFRDIEDVSINPLNNVVSIQVDPSKVASNDVRKWLEKCGYHCSDMVSPIQKDHSKMDHSKMDQSEMDQSEMDHSKMVKGEMDHSKMDQSEMDHSKMVKGEMDHSKMDHGDMADVKMVKGEMDHSKMDHGNHHQMMVKEFKIKTILVFIATIPVLLLSPTVQDWLDIEVINFGFNKASLVILSTLIVFYGASTFFSGARRSLRTGVLDMSVLITLAVLSGYFYSLAATFIFDDVADFYWEISTLVLFLDFGHWMEMRAVAGASGALNALVKLIPPTANLIQDENIIEVETSVLKEGDLILIRPGDKIPIDGTVTEGNTNVNESMLTGEAKPINKKSGDLVIGGTLNQTGSIKVKVDKTGEDTALSQIINLVKSAQSTKPKSQKIADQAAHYLTLVAIIVGALTFIFWSSIASAGFVFALTLTITVLVIACPHALGLAIPTVTSISTTLAAQNGILIKDMIAMELAKDLDYIVFDKTGTLTKGEFGVSDIVTYANWSEEELLSVVSALELNSEHVIGKGIVNKAREMNLTIPPSSDFNSIPGKGAEAVVKEKKIYVGNAALMESLKIDLNIADKKFKELSSQGKTVVYTSTSSEVIGMVALSDVIRDESKDAIISLRNLGVKTAMLTGDNELTAAYVAKELDLDTYFADVLPGQKSEKIQELQSKGYKVAMVGDGVNDAPALTQADLGIAIGAGTDVAVDSAEIVLVKNNPLDIVSLFELSRATSKKMKQNLVWATGYNAIAIPVAAGVLIPVGISLRPEVAAIIMALSSIIVVTNAFLLKKLKLGNK